MDIQLFQQYASLAAQFGATDPDPMLEALAESIRTRSAEQQAAAVTAFTDAGVDYRDFMPMSKQAVRAKKESLKIEQDRLDREAQRDFDNAMRAIRLEQEAIATASLKQTAINTGVQFPTV